MEKKLNCWEFKRCGREPGGTNGGKLSVCPAATDTSCNGLNRGKNGGRICWVVAGTFCGGKVQGTFPQKYGDCILCDFYEKVKEEEAMKLRVLKPNRVYKTDEIMNK